MASDAGVTLTKSFFRSSFFFYSGVNMKSLLDDSLRMAQRVKEYGVDVRLSVCGNTWHLFHLFGTKFTGGTAVFQEIGTLK